MTSTFAPGEPSTSGATSQRPGEQPCHIPHGFRATSALPGRCWPAIPLDGDELRDSAIRAVGGLLALCGART